MVLFSFLFLFFLGPVSTNLKLDRSRTRKIDQDLEQHKAPSWTKIAAAFIEAILRIASIFIFSDGSC